MHNNISPCETCDNGIPPADRERNLEDQPSRKSLFLVRVHRDTNNTRGGTSSELSKFIELEKKISRKTRFRAAELEIPIRFQSSRLSFLDPLFVFPAIFLRVPRGRERVRELFPPIFLKDFPLDWTILVTAHRTETTVYNTPETRIRYRFPMQLSHSFFFHLYISLPSVFSLKRFPYVKGNIWKSVSGTVPKFQFNLLHRSFVFLSLSLSPFKDFSLDWTHSSRCTVRRKNVYAVSKWVSRF